LLPPASSALGLTVAVLAAVTGAAIDARTGRIPNALTFATAAAGVGCAALASRTSSPAGAPGLVVGLACMLPGHLFGGTGAGDVKLMAAVGPWLGPERIVIAFLACAIAGGVLATWHAARRGRMSEHGGRTAQLVTGPAAARAEIDAGAPHTRFAYGPAIAAGVVLAASLALKGPAPCGTGDRRKARRCSRPRSRCPCCCSSRSASSSSAGRTRRGRC
jgi:Flp pilus assembly protein protease CpaA